MSKPFCSAITRRRCLPVETEKNSDGGSAKGQAKPCSLRKRKSRPPTHPKPHGDACQMSRLAKRSAVAKVRELFAETPKSSRGSLAYESEYSLPRNSFSKKASKSEWNASRVASRLGASSRSLT